MLVSNGDIWGAKEALAELMKEKLPIKTSYWLTKLSRILNEHLKDVEAVRTKLVVENGDKADNGSISVGPNSKGWGAFVEAFQALMSEEVDIPLNKVSISSESNLVVTPTLLLALEPFIDVTE